MSILTSDDEKLKRLGSRLKIARIKQNITQYKLALNCEMEKSSISKIEAGKINISYLTLLRFCKCLNIPFSDLGE